MEESSNTSSESNATDIAVIEAALARLLAAVTADLPRSRCLRRWSEFIRLRDGQRCVDCHSREHLSAHHICRKSFLAKAQFETGNGMTLCRGCHREAHRGFNGRADCGLPVDAQGGEKLPIMERFYSILLNDAVERQLLRDDFYFLSDDVLGFFKSMQGYSPSSEFPGSRLEQAYLILAEPEWQLRNAVAEANGFTFPEQPLLPGGAVLFWSDGQEPMVIKRYRPRST